MVDTGSLFGAYQVPLWQSAPRVRPQQPVVESPSQQPMAQPQGAVPQFMNALTNREAMLAFGSGLLQGGPSTAGALGAGFGNMQQAMRRQQEASKAEMLEQQARQQEALQTNQTIAFLKGKVPDDMLALAQVNPQVRMELVKRAMTGPAERKIIKGADGYQYYADDGSRVLPNVQRADGLAEQPKFGLSPVMGVDANGNPIMMQMSNQGGVRPVELPQGVRIQNKPMEVDAGTHTILIDQITRQPIATIPKNLAQAEAEKATGKAAGVASAAMPAAKGRRDTVIKLTDAVLAHPSLSAAVGPIDGMMPTFRGQTRDFESRVEQLRSEAFMAAREDLRGGGQITDFEGRKAEQALNRASLATDEASFRQAMIEFKERVERGYELLEMQAQLGGMQGQQAAPVQQGQMGMQPAPAQSGGLGVGQSVEVEPGITITKVR